MLKFFAVFGAVGNVLPPLAVVAIHIFWHLARKDPWSFDPKLYAGMFGESILWAIPIFVIGLAVTRHAAPGMASLPFSHIPSLQAAPPPPPPQLRSPGRPKPSSPSAPAFTRNSSSASSPSFFSTSFSSTSSR